VRGGPFASDFSTFFLRYNMEKYKKKEENEKKKKTATSLTCSASTLHAVKKIA